MLLYYRVNKILLKDRGNVLSVKDRISAGRNDYMLIRIFYITEKIFFHEILNVY